MMMKDTNIYKYLRSLLLNADGSSDCHLTYSFSSLTVDMCLLFQVILLQWYLVW